MNYMKPIVAPQGSYGRLDQVIKWHGMGWGSYNFMVLFEDAPVQITEDIIEFELAWAIQIRVFDEPNDSIPGS